MNYRYLQIYSWLNRSFKTVLDTADGVHATAQGASPTIVEVPGCLIGKVPYMTIAKIHP